jgi:hypothetical protein
MGYTLYNATAIRLSTDQSLLYYPALRRENIPACRCIADAATCDRVLVGVVDLSTDGHCLVDLGVGCGSPLLSTDGPRSMIATCSNTGASYQIPSLTDCSTLTPPISHQYQRLGFTGYRSPPENERGRTISTPG